MEKKLTILPAAVEDQLKVKPIYKSFKGWKSKQRELKNLMIYQKMQKLILKN